MKHKSKAFKFIIIVFFKNTNDAQKKCFYIYHFINSQQTKELSNNRSSIIEVIINIFFVKALIV